MPPPDDDTRPALADPGSFEPAGDELSSRDPLGFPGYADALAAARSTTTDEAVQAGPALIGGHEIELAAFRFDFMGGSMGEVAGERLARGLERAAARGVPFVVRTATGGARMQEGMASLVQMPKVVSARLALASARQPLIAVLGNPSTGGVLASLGASADVSIAEAGATIAFAGPRVAEHFTGKPVDPDARTAEAAFANGMVDAVVAPERVGSVLATILDVLMSDEPLPLQAPAAPELPPGRDAWTTVQAARAGDRPTGRAVIEHLASEWIELHGDRAGTDDDSLVTGFARVAGRRALVIAQVHGNAPAPAAYSKAIRCIDIASRLGVPVITLVDTPGADPSDASEAAGIAWAITRTFEAMLAAPVPLLAVVTGEGGSGGALALAVGDTLLMCEDSIFSVIGPEAAAAILWRDPARGPDAARLLKPTAIDLVTLGVADGVIPSTKREKLFRDAVAYHLGRLGDEPFTAADRARERQKRWRAK